MSNNDIANDLDHPKSPLLHGICAARRYDRARYMLLPDVRPSQD